MDEEIIRARELREAQSKAVELFREIEAQGLIRSGIKESQVNSQIYALADTMLGTTTYWRKRIIRAGRNTLLPYAENPPDLTIAEDDILFLDLGPMFEKWEADFGRLSFLVPTCRPQKFRPALRNLLFQAIIMMQSTEKQASI